ncbi:alkaline phosphatase D family protein [Sphingomonas sp. DT-204]|uniref:alkaline phosphatase D family protein n=1 Tax=Sphingomonas sp. DT-204 TaxID=3396166 RepID=UPI003F1E2A99
MLDRRTLLTGAAALAAARFAQAGVMARVREARLRLSADPFALGVASGDPAPDGFVLWTRVLGIEEDAAIAWEVAEDEGFKRIARKGRALAVKGRARAVHVPVRGLRPGLPYFYRFHLGGAVSRIGRTATIADDPQTLRLALTSCQHWEQGWFSAYRDMIAQRPDAVLQVGDYIYEKSFGAGPDVRSFGAPDPHTLDEYRARHALYRTDRDLADAHAALPFIVTWDDHEVENDYAGAEGGATADPVAFVRRRAAAYQAYFEHMPIDPVRLLPSGEARLYRRFGWGRLASVHMLDTRQYRTPHACGAPERRGGRIVRDCAAMTAAGATMLGRAQEAWLAKGLRDERAAWSLVAQQTLFSRLYLPQGREAAYSDIWDGYAATRERTLAALAQPAVRNPVLLGGDVHSFWINDVKQDFARPESPTVATEVVTSCLASRNGPEALFAPAPRLNPHVRFLDNAHAGYVLLDVTASRLVIDLRAAESLADPGSACRSLARYDVESGHPGIIA